MQVPLDRHRAGPVVVGGKRSPDLFVAEDAPEDTRPLGLHRFDLFEHRAHIILQVDHPVEVRILGLKSHADVARYGRALPAGADRDQVAAAPDDRRDDDIAGFTGGVVEEDAGFGAYSPDTVVESRIRRRGYREEGAREEALERLVRKGGKVSLLPPDRKTVKVRRE